MRFLFMAVMVWASLAAPVSAGPASSPDPYAFLMARIASEEGRYREALELFSQLIEREPRNAILHLERAEVFLATRQPAKAEEDLRKAVEIDPDLYDAQKLLGRVLLDRSGGAPGKVSQALEHLEAAHRLDPDDLGTALTISQILIGLDRTDDAEKLVERVRERVPNNLSINYHYAQILAKLGRGEESVVYLERVVSQDPLYRPAVFQLLEIYQERQQWAAAARLLQPLVQQEPLDLELQSRLGYFHLRAGDAGRARSLFEEILSVDPEDRRSRFFLAESLGELGRHEEAEPHYRALLGATPDDPELLISLGLNQLAQRDLEAGAALFEHLLSLPEISDDVRRLARIQLAAVEHEKENYPQALEMARESALQGNSPSLQAISIALEIYRRREQFEEAFRFLDQLDRKFPSHPVIAARRVEFLHRAGRDQVAGRLAGKTASRGVSEAVTISQAYAQLERYLEGAEVLERVLPAHPESVEILFQLGALYERGGNISGSEQAFRRLLEKQPDHAPSLNYLGYMWADRGEHLSEAVEMIARAVDQYPNNGAYVDSLGWVYYRLGKLDLAKKFLLDAARLLPDDPTILDHLGDVLADLGEVDGAIARYRQALKLEPEPEEETKIRSKIAELEKRLATSSIN